MIAVLLGIFTAVIPTCLLFQMVTYLFVVPFVAGATAIGLGIIARNRSRPSVMWIGASAVVLCVLGTCGPFAFLEYERYSGHPIEFVIADGYRGPIRLSIDPVNGEEVPLTDGVYTYRIGPDGTMRIKDASPFRRWHTTRARYANGTPIPIDHDHDPNPDRLFFQSVGAGRDHIDCFVGTYAERDKHFIR